MKASILFSKWPLPYLLIVLIFIKVLGILFAVEIFAKFTPLVDSNLYMQGAMNFDSYIRTRLVGVSASFLHQIGGIYLTHFIFSLFSILGLVYYYLTGGRRWVLMLFLILPSSLVWTSIAGKEALFFGATGVIIVIWSKYVLAKLSRYDLIFLVLFLIICIALRPHYSIGLFWLFFSTFIIKKSTSKKLMLISIFITFTLFCIVIFLGYDDLMRRGWGGIDPNARSSRFIYFEIVPSTVQGNEKFKSLIFIGFIFGIIGPMPTEALSRIELVPFFFEGIMVLLMPLLILLLARNSLKIHDEYFYRIFLYALIPAILVLMVIHAPFGILNPGSAVRWRINFEQFFYFAPLMLIVRFMDETKKENISLSSQW
jgi:hypothetical protein